MSWVFGLAYGDIIGVRVGETNVLVFVSGANGNQRVSPLRLDVTRNGAAWFFLSVNKTKSQWWGFRAGYYGDCGDAESGRGAHWVGLDSVGFRF